jgi:spore germination cell wall hydrolase CwlJ-like protein
VTDADLFALCVYQEACGEPYEGKAAVARVIHNRMAHRYFSDGTVAGTVLAYDQFSWAWFALVSGHYTRVCHVLPQAEALAEKLLAGVPTGGASWGECVSAVVDGAVGSAYAWGPQGKLLAAEPRALLYCNTAISQPAWATPSAEIVKIFHHTFYRA